MSGLDAGGPARGRGDLGVPGVLGRATAGPVVLRAVALGAGLAALVLAVPVPLWRAEYLLAALLLAVPAAVAPGSPWVSAVEYLAVVGWIAATTLSRYEIPPAQLAGLAVALYLHHTVAALAAATPLDAALAPPVLRAWLVRTTAVLAVSVGLGLILLGLPSLLGRSTSVLIPVLGLAALITAIYILTRQTRRP